MRPGIVRKIVLLYVKGCAVQLRKLSEISFSWVYDFRSIFHITYILICWKSISSLSFCVGFFFKRANTVF